MFNKSDILAAVQCPLLLWKKHHAASDIPAFTIAQDSRMEAGKVLGALARTLYPEGIAIDWKKDGFSQTEAALPERKPIFEAGFIFNDCTARADILVPAGESAWDIIEVKSTTSVKDVHCEDVAYQKYIYEGAGLRIAACSIMYVNKNYVRRNELEPGLLFITQEVTAAVSERQQRVGDAVSKAREIISQKEAPVVQIGLHCSSPYKCPLTAQCFAHIPPNSVLDLYFMKKYQAYDLVRDNIITFDQLPSSFNANAKQSIQIQATLADNVHVDIPAIKAFLSQVCYPLYYIDFETFSSIIPLFEGTHPNENIPFQYSLHIEAAPGAELTHHSFLADGKTDPREGFIASLCDRLGEEGSVVVYNRQFEAGILKACAKLFPAYAARVKNITSRIIDLLLPFRNFQYYNPKQQGSASIKNVLPALVGTSYEGMAIADGETASREYYRVTYTEDAADGNSVREHLEEYCGLDTKAMVDIVHALQGLTG